MLASFSLYWSLYNLKYTNSIDDLVDGVDLIKNYFRFFSDSQNNHLSSSYTYRYVSCEIPDDILMSVFSLGNVFLGELEIEYDIDNDTIQLITNKPIQERANFFNNSIFDMLEADTNKTYHKITQSIKNDILKDLKPVVEFEKIELINSVLKDIEQKDLQLYINHYSEMNTDDIPVLDNIRNTYKVIDLFTKNDPVFRNPKIRNLNYFKELMLILQKKFKVIL